MATFTAGQTINLSLDGNDTITWVGSGDMTVTPATGPKWGVHLEGSQTYGPFGQSVSVSIVTATSGSYTQNGYFADTGAPVMGIPTLNGGLGFSAGDSVGLEYARKYFGESRRGFPLLSAITSASGLSFVGQSGNAPTVEYIERDGMKGVRVTTAVGYWAEVSLPAFSKLVPKGQVEALFYVPEGKVGALLATGLYIGDTGYANSFVGSIDHSVVGCNQHSGYYTLAPDPKTTPADTARIEWSVVGGTPDFATTTMAAAKMRITPTAGQSAVVELFGIWANGSHSKPKVVFTADDGWSSVYTTGVPVLEKYGQKFTMAIIGDLIGTAGYMTLPQLQELVSKGHECVVHGPLGGTGSLVDNYTTTAQVLADVTYHRDYLLTNRLARNGSEKIYVYPQGKYVSARDDNTVLDAIRAAGFTAGRCAYTKQSAVIVGDAGKLPLFLPIIGHTWSSSDEAGNIARIIAKIQEAATQGRSVILVFHRITSGAATISTEISAANLELICRAVNDLESAGSIRAVTLGEFVSEIKAPE